MYSITFPLVVNFRVRISQHISPLDPYLTGNNCLLIEWSYDLACLELKTSNYEFQREDIQLKLPVSRFNIINMMYSTIN
jgi:hypothetical protein